MLKRQPQKIEPPKPEIRNPEIMKYEPQKPVSPHQDRKSSPAIEVPYKTETNQREPGQSSSYTMESTKSQSYQVKQYSSRRLVMENAQPVTEAISSFKDVMRADSEPNLALHSAPVTKSQTYQVKQQYSSKRSVMENVVQQPVTAAVPAQLKDVLRVEPEYKSILHGESTTHSPPKRLERAPDIMKIKSDIITMQEFSTDKVEKQDNIDFVPAQLHCSVGLDVDDFLPLSMVI